jgi:phenylpropionate dioxygenase-like ring-hydroxylating dioxygenase large terminal subunit
MSNSSITIEQVKAFESSIGPTTESRMMPPFIYTNSHFYEFEKEAVFGHEWLCVGRQESIPNKGDYFTTEYVGEPIIVVRSDSETITCLSAVCQHRGMIVADGSGKCNLFRCPYHHWVYALDGKLAGAPAMDRTKDFDRSKIALPSLRTEIWQGFIFINFDRNAERLGPRMARFDAQIEHYDLPNARGPNPDRFAKLPWNWKIMFENSNDGYHANRLHKGVLHDFCPSELNTWAEWREGDAAYLRRNQLKHMDGSWTPISKAMLPVFPQLSEEERTQIIFVNLPPTLWLALTPDQTYYFIMHPNGVNETWIDAGGLFTPEALQDPAFDIKLQAYKSTFQYFNNQDRYVDTLQQQGLQSRFANRGRLSWQEESSACFARWLTKCYRDRYDQSRKLMAAA